MSERASTGSRLRSHLTILDFVTDHSSPLQEAIKKLIEERFDAVSTVSSADVTPPEPSPAKRQASTNGVSDDGDTDLSASPEPAKKKVKQSSPEEDADARLAAQLQAQENALRQSRTTRGGDKPRPTKKKKTQRKKSLSKAEIDDDSDVNASVDSTAKPKRPQKMFNLSEQLSDLCDGEPQVCGLYREIVVKLTSKVITISSRSQALETHQGQ